MTAAGAPADLFSELYASLQSPVLNQITRLVRRPEVAEELAQEVWARLSEKLPEYAARSDFNGPALVSRAAQNRALDHLRRGQSAKAGGRVRFESLDLARAAGAPEPVAVAPAAGSDPDTRALAAVLYHFLPRRAARVLWLREAEELEYERISTMLRCSIPAIKALLFRARREQARIAAGGRVAGFAAAFWSFVAPGDRADRGRCWPWLGSANRHYGSAPQFTWRWASGRGRSLAARRLAYALEREPLPPWVYLSPTCATPACVNPWHVRPAIKQRGVGARPATGGTRAGDLGALPPGEAFRARRHRLRLTQRQVAAAAGVQQSTVSQVEEGRLTTPDTATALWAALGRLEAAGFPPAGAALRERRRALGVPAVRVAAAAGISARAMNKLECADRGSRALREAVAAALDRLSRPVSSEGI